MIKEITDRTNHKNNSKRISDGKGLTQTKEKKERD